MTRLFRCAAIVAVVASAAWLLSSIGTAQSAQTPRTADGKPDFSGTWIVSGRQGDDRPDETGNLKILDQGRPCHPGQIPCAPGVNSERDSGIRQRMGPNFPLYKPQFWAKVQELDLDGNAQDPGFSCYPAGVPRMGPPSKIVQTPTELIFLYQAKNDFRVIPIDGRPHDPIRALDQTWMGDSIGKWEGDTMVIDVVGLTGETWLGWPGYFHSNNIHVIERYRREGNTLTWEATVEDPDVLMKPWAMNPVQRTLNPDAKAVLQEDLPCEERDLENMVTKERG